MGCVIFSAMGTSLFFTIDVGDGVSNHIAIPIFWDALFYIANVYGEEEDAGITSCHRVFSFRFSQHVQVAFVKSDKRRVGSSPVGAKMIRDPGLPV